VKVTEKSLKARCTEVNLHNLRDTSFGIAFERGAGGYTVEMKYRDATPPRILAADVTAAEAAAVIEGVIAGASAVKAAGAVKPEYITIDTFVRQNGLRCVKCQTKDIVLAHLATGEGRITQKCSCSRCGQTWDSIYMLNHFDQGAVDVAAEA